MKNIQFTEEEMSLLQSVLACMNSRLDWDFDKNNGLIEANIPNQISHIYNKLF